MVLPPDGIDSEAFVNSGEGQKWKAVGDKYGIAIVTVGPANGGTWNISDDASGRNDTAYLKTVYTQMKNKNQNTNSAPFDSESRAIYLVGYQEGGAAAHKFGAAWSVILAGLVTFDSSEVPAATLNTIGNDLCYPFAQDGNSVSGQAAINLANKNVPLPVWIIKGSADAASLVNYWVATDEAVLGIGNDLAQAVYANGPNRVWVTESANAASLSPEVVYTKFLSQVQRFLGNPGGTLEWTIDIVNDGKYGFFKAEITLGGKIRRYVTYIPPSYRSGNSIPLVLAMHGYSSCIEAFIGDSRWHNVADRYGLIVVFPQAYPNGYTSSDTLISQGAIDMPTWHTYDYQLDANATDDVAFLRELVQISKQKYSIDPSRVYVTGHSNGASMASKAAIEAADIFTAAAPVGFFQLFNYGSTPAATNLIPVWVFMGQYDVFPYAVNSYGQSTISYWVARNQTTDTYSASAPWGASVTGTDNTGRYVSWSWCQGIAPLYRYTQVANANHSYMPYESELIWIDFFSKYGKQNGDLYYEGANIGNPY
ncbi:hypothetical protein AGMMS50293_26350 [Spirochaetia bacterium]|nr:hypothetical protein AGMMS50293_26350 [Spirochaetia bacterium]